MRLTSDLWAKAYLRRCNSAGVFATVVRHGDDYAGAIHIKVHRLDRTAALYGPAPSFDTRDNSDDRLFAPILVDANEADVDAWIARQVSFDSDIWVIEVEDREGRHFLEDQLAKPD